MDWLWNNPLGTMYGPYFLGLYLAVIVTVIVGSRWLIRQADETRREPTPPVPAAPDPYLVAWLRGGTNEVARLALFDLLQQGRIEQVERKGVFGLSKKQILQRSADAKGDDLSPLQTSVWKWLGAERDAATVFQSGLPDAVKPHTETLQADCERLGLATQESGTHGQRLICGFGLVSILALGGYKLAVALSTGHHNVAFLLFLGIAGAVFQVLLAKPQRLTDLGRRTLAAMQTAYAGLKAHSGDEPSPALLLAMGVFGVAVLQGTAYGGFYDLYRQSAASAGGCGSSCGSSCGGGGGGGGGCGGCGGD